MLDMTNSPIQVTMRGGRPFVRPPVRPPAASHAPGQTNSLTDGLLQMLTQVVRPTMNVIRVGQLVLS